MAAQSTQEPDAPAGRGGWQEALERLGDIVVPEDNPSGQVYGTILTAALIAAEASSRNDFLTDVLGLVVVLAIFWLAHAYSEALGHRVSSPTEWTLGTVWRLAVHEAAILKGAAVPLIVVVLVEAFGGSRSGSLLAGDIAAAVLLCLFELVAGVRTKSGPLATAVLVALSVIIGLAVLGIYMLVH